MFKNFYIKIYFQNVFAVIFAVIFAVVFAVVNFLDNVFAKKVIGYFLYLFVWFQGGCDGEEEFHYIQRLG